MLGRLLYTSSAWSVNFRADFASCMDSSGASGWYAHRSFPQTVFLAHVPRSPPGSARNCTGTMNAQAQARATLRGEPACRPGSVHPRERGPTAIHLGLPLPAASCGLPASIGRAALNRSRRPRAPEGARPL